MSLVLFQEIQMKISKVRNIIQQMRLHSVANVEILLQYYCITSEVSQP